MEMLVLCRRFAALQNRLQHVSLLRLHCVDVAMSKVANESVGLIVSDVNESLFWDLSQVRVIEGQVRVQVQVIDKSDLSRVESF